MSSNAENTTEHLSSTHVPTILRDPVTSLYACLHWSLLCVQLRTLIVLPPALGGEEPNPERDDAEGERHHARI